MALLQVPGWRRGVAGGARYRPGELAEALARPRRRRANCCRDRGLSTSRVPEFDARVRIYSLPSAPMALRVDAASGDDLSRV